MGVLKEHIESVVDALLEDAEDPEAIADMIRTAVDDAEAVYRLAPLPDIDPLVPAAGKAATETQKLRLWHVDKVVGAVNTLVMFDKVAAVVGPALPSWYTESVAQIDQLANGIQDHLKEVDR